MINQIIRICWLNLKRDRVALLLSFVLPLVFFSIFALIFGGMGASDSPTGKSTLSVIVVDEDNTRESQSLIKALASSGDLVLISQLNPTGPDQNSLPYTRDSAWTGVRKGRAPIAVVIKQGFSQNFANFNRDNHDKKTVELLYDPSNVMALPAVNGLLQAASFQAAPDVLMTNGFAMLEKEGAPMTQQQKETIDQLAPYLRGEKEWPNQSQNKGQPEELQAEPLASSNVEEDATKTSENFVLIQVEKTDVFAKKEKDTKKQNSIVAYYAAAISVMFLLFSMSSAAGSLLEEQENGTLERLLSTKLSLNELLIGKWIFYAAFGVVQLMLMFAWGNLIFGLEFWSLFYFFGSLTVAIFTAATAAAFGLLLAAFCKTRAQLGGLSTIVILIMSALGGSMVPKMFMPSFMQSVSLFTFNGQALDAFLLIFWRFDPNLSGWQNFIPVLPKLMILAGICAALLWITRRLSNRWQAA